MIVQTKIVNVKFCCKLLYLSYIYHFPLLIVLMKVPRHYYRCEQA